MELIFAKTSKSPSKTYPIPTNISMDIMSQLRRLGQTDIAALEESMFLSHSGVCVAPNVTKEWTKLGIDCSRLDQFIANVREKK